MEGMRIRPATIGDSQELQRFAAELFGEHLPGIFDRPIPTLEEERAFIASYLDSPNSTLLMAEVDGVAVGLLDFRGEELAERRHAGTFGVSVARGWRGRGIGSALIEALCQWAPSQGISRIEGHVIAENPRALALYQRLGFVQEGRMRAAMIREGRPVDVHMVGLLVP